MSSICLSKREIVRLAPADGTTIPYNGVKPPKLLETPLVIDDNGNGCVTGFKSGERSAIARGYKLKGCNPKENRSYHGLGEHPFGGMTTMKCLNELDSNNKISRKYESYGLKPPLIPVGRFEYEVYFKNQPISCAVLKCNGDTRISEAEGKLLSLQKRHPDLWNYEYLDKLFSGIAACTGFNHRILQETEVAPAEISFDLDNYVLHNVNKSGYGVARVDLASAKHGSEAKELLEKKKEFDKKELTDLPRTFCVAEVARKFGIPFKNIWQGYFGKKEVSIVEESGDKEWKEEDVKNIILHVRSDRFAWVEQIEKTYLRFAEGKEVSQPISKEIIYPLFY